MLIILSLFIDRFKDQDEIIVFVSVYPNDKNIQSKNLKLYETGG
jgi:hypothetical protein